MSFVNSYRFSSGSSFRYLHDEVSGGLHGYSHMLVKSSYAGALVRVGVDDYSPVNNVVDLSQIQSDYPTSQAITFYDQIQTNDLSQGAAGVGWDGTDFSSARRNSVSPLDTSIDLQDAKTIIAVLNPTTLNGIGLFTLSNSSAVYQSGMFAGAGFANLWLRKSNGSNTTRQYNGQAFTGLNLVCWVDGGSLTMSDTDLYLNDMVTPLTPSSTSGSIANAKIVNTVGIKEWAANTSTFDGYGLELHVFDKALNQTERETVKEILEQYYTFP